MKNKVYTYDIFDTCLSRICGDAHYVFEILAQRILGSDVDRTQICDFARIRRDGEVKAREKYTNFEIEDVTISEIYDECDLHQFTNYSKDFLIETELQVESDCLLPIFNTYLEIEEIHKRGEYVVYISDMYLPSQFIKNVLIREGFWKQGDKLYVSSEVKKTKATGNLFKYVLEDLGIQPKLWIHKGDNPHSDFVVPRKLGITAIKVENRFSAYEDLRKSYELSTTYNTLERYASLIRSLRISLPQTPYNLFAIEFIAPIIVPFVYKLLKAASAKEIKNLYFLARDSNIFYLVAGEMQSLFPDISLHYLYVSRDSLYLPGLKDLEKDTVLRCFNKLEIETTHSILRRLHLDHLQIPGSDNLKGVMALDYLFEQEAFVTNLHREYNDQKELVIKYFRQEGVTNENSAIVDLSGTRKCQQRINNILNSYGYSPVFAFYLEGLRHRLLGVDYTCHFLQEREDINIYNKGPQNIWEEYFCITNQLRTHSYYYNKEKGRVEPVFEKDAQSKELKDFIYKTNKSICVKMAQSFVKFNIDKVDTLIDSSMKVYTNFVNHPKYYYLKVFDGFRVSESSINSEFLFPKLSYKSLRNLRKQQWQKAFLVYHFPFAERYIPFLVDAIIDLVRCVKKTFIKNTH